jgi:peroxiredoxin Q/BCP
MGGGEPGWWNGRVLHPGTPAPDFTLPDQDGRPVRLRDLRGQWVLLWWYPKAATPG